MNDSLLRIKNDNGEVVYMSGLLPDGTFGVVADEARPFTEEELTSLAMFQKHREDLTHRVDESMRNISQV